MAGVKSRAWRLRSPTGEIYVVRNIQEFVRTNTNLFDPADVEWKRSPGGVKAPNGELRWKSSERCNASQCLQRVKRGLYESWKGWEVFDKKEVAPQSTFQLSPPESSGKRRWTDEENVFLMRNYLDYTTKEIAYILNRTVRSVERHLNYKKFIDEKSIRKMADRNRGKSLK